MNFGQCCSYNLGLEFQYFGVQVNFNIETIVTKTCIQTWRIYHKTFAYKNK